MQKFSQRKKKNLSWILVICFFLILIIIIFLILRSNFFNIKKIEIKMDKNLGCVSEDQLRDSSHLLGQNLFQLNLNAVKNIKEKFICVQDVILSKQFPDKVKLDVIGRQSLIKLLDLNNEASQSASLESIATPSAEQPLDTYLADDEIIFAKDTNQIPIPKIYLYNSNLSMGKRLDELEKNSLHILEKIKILGLNIQTTQIIDQFLVIFPSDSEPKIIFSLERDIETQIGSLQLILKTAKMNEENLEFIDLRFDKPVVKYAPKKK